MREKYQITLQPFKFGKDIGYNHAALHRSVHNFVVFKKSKHVSAVIHGKAAD